MDEVGELVERFDRTGFVLHRLCIERAHPDILIGTYHWGYKIDVVIVIDELHAHAYRVARGAVVGPPGHPDAPSGALNPPN